MKSGRPTDFFKKTVNLFSKSVVLRSEEQGYRPACFGESALARRGITPLRCVICGTYTLQTLPAARSFQAPPPGCELCEAWPPAKVAPLRLLVFVTATFAGGASMSLNSQTRNVVSRVLSAQDRGLVSVAVTSHRLARAKVRLLAKRRTHLPYAGRVSAALAILPQQSRLPAGQPHRPGPCPAMRRPEGETRMPGRSERTAGIAQWPALWAAGVLGKFAQS